MLPLAEPIGNVDSTSFPTRARRSRFPPTVARLPRLVSCCSTLASGARTTQSGPVTLDRVMSIINRQCIGPCRATSPQLLPGAPEPGVGGSDDVVERRVRDGAYAPIGRAGAQDVAAMYFSSTEIAGGAIVVGLPRSGKSTALHAAILSLSDLSARGARALPD